MVYPDIQNIEATWTESHSVVSDSWRPHGLYSPWNSLGQNTGMGSLSLLQGILPTQGSNPVLTHCRRILYHLSCQGSPRILERVAYPFSSRSSQPRNQTGVSCIADGFFTNWAIREALCLELVSKCRERGAPQSPWSRNNPQTHTYSIGEKYSCGLISVNMLENAGVGQLLPRNLSLLCK